MQELKLQIQQQAEQIEKLSNSDKELKMSEELKKQSNEQVKNAQEEVSNAKCKYARLSNEAKQSIETAKQDTEEAQKLKKELQIRINQEVKKQNNNFKLRYSGIVVIVSIYAFLVTLFTALRSESFISDLQAFFGTIWTGVSFYFKHLSRLSESLADASKGIGQEAIATIVYWLLFVLVALVGMALPLALLLLGGKWLVGVYRRYCADELSVLVALFSLAIIVFFADVFTLNVFLLLLIFQAIYIGIRWVIHHYKEARS
jgi:cation transport ATPase